MYIEGAPLEKVREALAPFAGEVVRYSILRDAFNYVARASGTKITRILRALSALGLIRWLGPHYVAVSSICGQKEALRLYVSQMVGPDRLQRAGGPGGERR